MLADAGSIPAISTNNKGHLILGGLFYWLGLVRMRTRVPGSLKSSGAILDARYMRSLEEVKYMDVFHNSRKF